MRSLGDEKYVNQLRMGGGGKGSHEEGRLVVAIDSGGVGAPACPGALAAVVLRVTQ